MTPPRSSGALPSGSDRSGIPGQHHRVERSDVNAQLQRIGRHHAERFAVAQLPLDLAALARQISPAIAANRRRRDRAPVVGFLQITNQDFHRQPVVGEYQSAQPAVEKSLCDTACLGDIAAANSQLPIDHRWIIEDEIFLPAGGAVFGNRGYRLPGQGFGQLFGISDCGAATDELRLGTVKLTDAFEPPENVGGVAAENAAIGMQLVDHDVAQILEEPRPTGVVRQHSGVQHIGIGQHDAGSAANGSACVLRRVAVIGKGANIAARRPDQPMEFGELIFGQGLGGKQIKGASVGIFEKLVEDGQIVAKRLAAGGRRHQNHVFACPDTFERFGLVAVEARDTALGQDFFQPRVNRFRQIGKLALASRQAANRRDRRVGLPPQRLHLLDHAFERAVAACQRIAGSRGLNLQGLPKVQREVGCHG